MVQQFHVAVTNSRKSTEPELSSSKMLETFRAQRVERSLEYNRFVEYVSKQRGHRTGSKVAFLSSIEIRRTTRLMFE